MKDIAKYEYQSYWPEEQEIEILLDTSEVRLGKTDASEIEPGASLLVWAADSPAQLLRQLKDLLPDLPRPLYTKIPGPEEEVRPLIASVTKLGFTLQDLHLDMRLKPLPRLEFPAEVLSGPDLDFAALAAVDAAVFPHYQQNAEELSSIAASQDGAVFSINIDAKPVGLIIGRIYGPQMDHLFVRSLAVLPEYRRQGLGRKLTTALLAWGQKQGADRSMLWLSDVQNQPARRLYESFGYKGHGVEAEMVYK